MNHPPSITASDRKLIEAYFRSKPEQTIGCPGTATLRQIARGKLPPADLAYNHLTNCSKCFRRTEQLHAEAKRQRIWVAIGAVAAGVIAVAILWRPQINTPETKPARIAEQAPLAAIQQQQPTPPPPKPAAKPPQPKPVQFARLDYSAFAPLRGGEGETRPAPTLPRRRTRLKIILPVASLTGPYEVQIVNTALVQQIEIKGGKATTQNGQTILTLPNCDLTSLKSGSYSLALRPPHLDWSLFPIEVK